MGNKPMLIMACVQALALLEARILIKHICKIIKLSEVTVYRI